MSIVDGTKIVAPVSVEDVRRVLGERSLDIGTLCTSDKINKWARNKPIRGGGVKPMTDAEKKKFSYGIGGIPTYTNPNDLAANIYPPPVDIFYFDPPLTSGKRLSDFDGYNHHAKPPIAVNLDDVETVEKNKNFDVMFDTYGGADTVQLFDLHLPINGASGDLDDYYFGAIITDGSIYRAVVQTTPLSEFYRHDSTLTFNAGHMESLLNKEVSVCPFLCPTLPEVTETYPCTNLTLADADRPYVALTFATKRMMFKRKMVSSDFGIEVTARRNSSNTAYIDVTYTITNKYQLPVTVEPTILIHNAQGGPAVDDYVGATAIIKAGESIERSVQILCDNDYAEYVMLNVDVVDGPAFLYGNYNILGRRFECAITKASRNSIITSRLDIVYTIANLTAATLSVKVRFEVLDSDGALLLWKEDTQNAGSGTHHGYTYTIENISNFASRLRITILEDYETVAYAEKEITDY